MQHLTFWRQEPRRQFIYISFCSSLRACISTAEQLYCILKCICIVRVRIALAPASVVHAFKNNCESKLLPILQQLENVQLSLLILMEIENLSVENNSICFLPDDEPRFWCREFLSHINSLWIWFFNM